jgi:hypothetical protein
LAERIGEEEEEEDSQGLIDNTIMITQLSTIKARLGIDPIELRYDALLTNAILAVSARFDKECNRVLARTINATHEFADCEREIVPLCYPIESVSKFELKSSEAEGWVEQTGVGYLIRRSCVISLLSPLSDSTHALGRVTYNGGYVLPGATPAVGQTGLPDDIEQAAVEQIAAWFQMREMLGLVRHWPKGGVYQQFAQTELLLVVRAVLEKYRRWSI